MGLSYPVIYNVFGEAGVVIGITINIIVGLLFFIPYKNKVRQINRTAQRCMKNTCVLEHRRPNANAGRYYGGEMNG